MTRVSSLAPAVHRAAQAGAARQATGATTAPARQAGATPRILPAQTPGHHRNCNCLPCCDLAAAWTRNRNRQIGYGTWRPFVDAGPVRAHVEALHAQGMAYRQIAQRAGMTLWDLHQLRTDRTKLRPATAQRVLDVRLDLRAMDPKAFVPPRGTTRRIHALRAIGWPARELARRASVHADSITRIPRSPYVWVATHLAFEELYDDLHDQDPVLLGVPAWVVKRSLRQAAEEPWAPPSAWQDIDLDEQPAPREEWRIVYARPEPAAARQAVIEDTAELARLGCTREEIAERLGRTWSYIVTIHSREQTPVPPVCPSLPAAAGPPP